MCGTRDKDIPWRVCLLVAPAVLASIEFFHPSGFMADAGMDRHLAHAGHREARFGALDYLGPACLFAMHMIQT